MCLLYAELRLILDGERCSLQYEKTTDLDRVDYKVEDQYLNIN